MLEKVKAISDINERARNIPTSRHALMYVPSVVTSAIVGEL